MENGLVSIGFDSSIIISTTDRLWAFSPTTITKLVECCFHLKSLSEETHNLDREGSHLSYTSHPLVTEVMSDAALLPCSSRNCIYRL
jgi:hypothetical protein